jgi:hypothetical protein
MYKTSFKKNSPELSHSQSAIVFFYNPVTYGVQHGASWYIHNVALRHC